MKLNLFLLRPRERLRSIVMSMSVCGPVCLSVQQDVSGITRAIFTKFFVHVAYVHGSVILRHLCDRQHRLLSSPLKMHYRPGKGMGMHTASRSVHSHPLSCEAKYAIAFANFVYRSTTVSNVKVKVHIFIDSLVQTVRLTVNFSRLQYRTTRQ